MTHDLISTWIAAARKHAGLNQSQLGEELGVTKANVSAWETNKHEPSINQLVKIVEITKYPAPSDLIKKLSFSEEIPKAHKPLVSNEEQKIIAGFRAASEADRETLLWLANRALKPQKTTSQTGGLIDAILNGPPAVETVDLIKPKADA